ncbi:hypothetical protein BJX63DRAFT_240884 [Aspergillus granulosus]|uniref:Uncharacterized protein n=1 Tax=Aspergillus granulosus TaxID=176169 RepID=A0ABR4HBM0_9EURO
MSNDRSNLSAAAADGNIPLVFSVIEIGHNCKPSHQSSLNLALRYAAERGHLQLVKKLLRHSAKVDSPYSIPPILGAAKHGSPETVEALLRHHRLLPCWPWGYRKGKWMMAFLDAAARGLLDNLRIMLKNGLPAN